MNTLRYLAVRPRWAPRVMSWAWVLGSTAVVLAQGVPPEAASKVSTATVAEKSSTDRTTCYSMWDVISGSVRGTPCDERIWTPLCFDTLFSEGWREPWIAPPAGSSGAPRHGWINTFDGFFTREWHLVYAFTNELSDGSEAHLGLFQVETPLSRRLWLGIDVPFVVGIDGDHGASNEADFGDIQISPRVMLQETQDRSISAQLGIRIPTGEAETGGDLTALFPHVNYWQDIGCGWSLRGGVGFVIPTEESVSPDATFVLNAAIGHTVTPHENAPLGDLTYYMSMNLGQDLSAADDHTFLSFTPGIRTHLGNNLFFQAGIEVPVTGPETFDQRAIFVIVKGF